MPSKSRQKTSKSESAVRSPNRVPRTGAKPVKGKPEAAAATKPAARTTATTGSKTAAKTAAKSAAKSATQVSSPIAEGQQAPSFSVTRDGGTTVGLADYRGKNLVIFFYPRADTPGCTLEAADFSRLAGDFAKQNTALLGVSADSQKLQEKFRDKHQLKVPLGADEKLTMLNAYGVWGEKSMYGRTFMGVLRTTVLVNARGKIVKIWRNVKVEGHAIEVLSEAKCLIAK